MKQNLQRSFIDRLVLVRCSTQGTQEANFTRFAEGPLFLNSTKLFLCPRTKSSVGRLFCSLCSDDRTLTSRAIGRRDSSQTELHRRRLSRRFHLSEQLPKTSVQHEAKSIGPETVRKFFAGPPFQIRSTLPVRRKLREMQQAEFDCLHS